MKISQLAAIAAVFSLAVACDKPMSEAERNAQIEREVQQRLEAERVAQDKERLEQQQADLDAREKALADKEAAGNRRTTTTAAATPRTTATARQQPRTTSNTTKTRDGRPARSYDTFYRKLEPYGAWRETADYGYVWQPERAQRSRDWRPYTDGRWAYTDAGWTWVSEEPFGWATYHYGRWTRLRGVGWVWVPGDEWAPAWVSWRTSDEYVGWAPLPPEARFERRTGIKRWADSYYDIDVGEYVFVPNAEIGAQQIERVAVPTERNVSIVTQTTNVTNITYNNTYIVNEGPSYEDLRARSRQPVERLRIDRRYEFEEDENPRASINGGVIAMMAPLFAPQMAERPRKLAEPIRQVVAERAIAVTDNAEAQRARAQMKAEATPPPDAPSKTYEKPTVVESTPESAAAAPTATATATPVATATATATATPASTATATATPAPTATATATATATPRATATATAEPTATATATPRATATATATPQATATPTPRATIAPTATPTATPAATPRATATPVATATPTATVRATAAPAATATPTAAPTATPVSTPDDEPTATPAAIPRNTPTGIATPPAASPRATASPAADPDVDGTPETAAATGASRAEQREAVRAQRERQREEARNARINEMRAPRQAAAPAAAPAQADEGDADDTAATATQPARRRPVVPVPDSSAKTAVAAPTTAPERPATTDDADATPTPTATPTPSPSPNERTKKGKRAAQPSEDVDVADDAEDRPEGTDEP